MASNARYVTDAQLTVIGRRYKSEEVAVEATEAVSRWRRDLETLAGYGFGKSVLDEFMSDLEHHSRLRAARPEAVAEKRSAAATRDQSVSRGWAWVDRVGSMLGVLARTDRMLSTALDEAIPTDDAGLRAGILALATILVETKAFLPGDAHVDDRLSEVADLCKALQESQGEVPSPAEYSVDTVRDTANIDQWDGRLWVSMRDLNAAGRAAIRNGDLRANVSEYTFHHLKQSGNSEPSGNRKVDQ